MEENSTTTLLNVLKHTGREDLGRYRETYLKHQTDSFPAYMDALIAQRHLKRQDIFQKADLPQKYGYKLLSGERHTTDRDKLLRIFLAMGLDLKEVQRALTLYGLPVLYPKLRRDAVFIIAINQGITDVDTVDQWLREEGESELTRSGE